MTSDQHAGDISKCPVMGGKAPRRARWRIRTGGRISWIFACSISNPPTSDPMGEAFDYAKEFLSFDLEAVRKDLYSLMTDSQDWWPADYGHYGPLFIRMAWHSAGTYRVADGRGGSWFWHAAVCAAEQLAGQREPRQGASASVADQAEVRPQTFVGGPDGSRGEMLRLNRWDSRRSASAADARMCGNPRAISIGGPRQSGSATSDTAAIAIWKNPLAAVQMGLIYVNPEGPNGNPDPLASARDIRETFARMAMNDEETVALIAGGHTFRQDAWRGERHECRARTRRRRHRAAGSRLGEQASAAAKASIRSRADSRGRGLRRRRSGTTATSTRSSAMNGNWSRARPVRSSGRPRQAAARARCQMRTIPSAAMHR
jgi:catalase-peroxidase